MTIFKPALILLDFIGQTEAPRGYDTVYGNNQAKLTRPITTMTIAQVIAAGPGWTKRFGSSAAGRYQFMRATLQGLVKEGKADPAERFDRECQDRLGYLLLVRRGYLDFMLGRIGRTEFGKRLAMEWASFPVLAAVQGAHRKLKRGQSYYAGDGLNKALVSAAKVEGVLDAVLAAAKAKEAPAAPEAAEDPERAPAAPATTVEPPSADDPGAGASGEGGEKLSRSKRLWTWLTTGGGTAVLPFVDWRVQVLIAGAIVAIAIYAIVAMPKVRARLGGLLGIA